MKVAPHTLRRTITEQDTKNHAIYLLKCKIINCEEQIDFFTEILNNPKASVDIQRKMIFNIEGEELNIIKLNEQLNKLI
jgi:hypothetical protein